MDVGSNASKQRSVRVNQCQACVGRHKGWSAVDHGDTFQTSRETCATTLRYLSHVCRSRAEVVIKPGKHQQARLNDTSSFGHSCSTLGVGKDTNFERMQHRLEFMGLSFELLAVDVFAGFSATRWRTSTKRTMLRCDVPSSYRKYARLLFFFEGCDVACHGASGAELRRHLISFLLRGFGLSSEGFDKTPFRHFDVLLLKQHRPSEAHVRRLVQMPLGCCCHLFTHEVFDHLPALEPRPLQPKMESNA